MIYTATVLALILVCVAFVSLALSRRFCATLGQQTGLCVLTFWAAQQAAQAIKYDFVSLTTSCLSLGLVAFAGATLYKTWRFCRVNHTH
ncbi:hypothetical protein B2_24 [Stenotrophomonas phage B2]|nr:hypothetical protein B2_24 [Stenotrophomonas phage B2]